MVRKYQAALAVALGMVLTAGSIAQAASITDNAITVSGTAGTDFYVWTQVGNTLVRNEAVLPNIVLQGTQPAPGGNIELFVDSELPAPGSETYRNLTNPGVFAAFVAKTRTSISGTINGKPIAVSSLNGADWFTPFGGGIATPAYGANNLANKWLSDFFGYYNLDGILAGAGFTAPQILAARQGLYAQFLTNNGFPRLSDPNISYVNQASPTDLVEIGLAGSDDFLTGAIQALLAGPPLNRPDLVPLVPLGMQASELVRVEYDGGPATYLYSFSAIPVDLATTDGTESYNAEFQVTIPEPASLSVLALGGLALLARRRRV